jgi:RHH-type proline utilization regulon transcriptional repressor/proline dehydrogenase/delta 1-pyrroline-5-carboxylate dehydrogenase
MTPHLIERAIALAGALQLRAAELQTPAERRQQAELDRMLQTPSDKATLVQLTDQAFRARSKARIADQFAHILDVQGIPRFFNPWDRALLKGFQTFGEWAPGLAVPLVKEHMQHETEDVILPAEPDLLRPHLQHRRSQGVRMNINFLGEAILSEVEAERRLEQYLEALQLPDSEVFSVKISTLYSQMSAIAREHTIAEVSDRLERLYRTALRSHFTRGDGTKVTKFIYLDMEEYRDLSLTCEIFMRTLDRTGLEQARAGIALQAYIPDSAAWQRRLNDWARARLAAGKGPVTVRLVKGANMEMEGFEAAVKGWPQAPYRSKRETDANYKRMLLEGLRAENIAAVQLGVASHNLFDVALALVLAQDYGAIGRVQFEMLEGMANAQRRALLEHIHNLLLYAPVCHQHHFLSAIGYLIRRLDENTGPENFLRHAFNLIPGSEDWRTLERGFRDSCALAAEVTDAPRRTQDRRRPPLKPPAAFSNEPDTDWSLPHHSEWAAGIIEAWRHRQTEVPLVVDGHEVRANRATRSCLDPSRPSTIIGHYVQAHGEDIQRAVDCADRDPDHWRELSFGQRREVMRNVAQEIRRARADLIGAALANTGKTIAEADPEVSEAVDFVEFYAESACWYAEELSPHLRARGKGVAAVVSPWNFPIAIPCGGVAAALAAGNTVILKPASDAVLVAWELCQCFWRGGVSKRVLQFLPCSGGHEARTLVNDPRVHSVILTGGTETAMTMLRANPNLRLSAETGGKNATIVTALADRDQAIKNVLHSAFSHAGQKCSATSLLLLEAEVYDDEEFRRMLVEAAESLIVGPAWQPQTKMGPLIRPPTGDLQNALLTLEPGESWVLMPKRDNQNPNLWTPGIKYGVRPGSYTHTTEFFGPVLGVMRFETLAEAIQTVNETGYGLTSGLESLDDREQEEWREGIRAGNLYINRGTTGAVVLRQPFGGMGKSAVGPGLKAGGPNYVTQLMDFTETVPETPATPAPHSELGRFLTALQGWDTLNLNENSRLITAFASYERWWREEFSREHDPVRLLGQDNLRRYRPVERMRVRLHPQDSAFDVFARAAAAHICGSGLTISSPPGTSARLLGRLRTATATWPKAVAFVEESDEELQHIIRGGQADRLRYAGSDRVPLAIRRAAVEANLFIADAPVLMEGRLELLHYLREQSISHDYHRYGNLGYRAGEARTAVL